MRLLRDGGWVLEIGDRGDFVKKVQKRLLNVGFPPGPVDGIFGPATRQAVKYFQEDQNLYVDGVVGKNTYAALFPERGFGAQKAESNLPLPRPRPPARALLRGEIMELFPYANPERVMEHYALVLDALATRGLDDAEMQAMALATIAVETSRFEPIDEYESRYNTPPGGPAYSLYDHRTALGNKHAGDGARYRGRGFIQLTGRHNYGRMQAVLGTELLEFPSRANEPEIAAAILATFLAEREGKIQSALSRGDLARARRVVNGGHHGLPKFKRVYARALTMLQEEEPDTMNVCAHG